MTVESLERVCMQRFGNKGKILFRAMEEIRRKDFCVATGFDENEVSIAKSCTSRGQIFKFSEGYKNLIAPDGLKINIATAAYGEIAKYLPKSPKVDDEWKHCAVDV
jgi:hypothetical protein